MAAVKAKLGRIPCDGCGHPTLVKENEHKTLTMQCDECDMSTFAKHGTACAARWRAKLPKNVAPGEKSTPAAPVLMEGPGDDQPPAPKKKAEPFQSLFGIGGK